MQHIRRPASSAAAAKRLASRAVPAAAGGAGVGGMVVLVNPRSVAAALGHFNAWTLLPVFLFIVTFYALQGFRWHFLLRAVGAPGRATDHQLINLAGQALTAVLPLGDLTRALLASKASGVEFGATAATVTVQELTFTLLVVVAAAPGLAHMPNGSALMLAVMLGIAGVIAILIVPSLFGKTRSCAAHTPGVRRFVPHLDSLQREVCRLLRRPDVLIGSVLDLGRVLCANAALLFVLLGLHIDFLSWWDVTLVLAASFVGGALSMLPGGVGANEASVVGMLVLLGVNPAAAAAAAVVQRLSLTLVPTVGGAIAYVAIRRRGRLERRVPQRRPALRSVAPAQLVAAQRSA